MEQLLRVTHVGRCPRGCLGFPSGFQVEAEQTIQL